MKRSVILTDRLGPDILRVLTMKRQVLHRERAHLIKTRRACLVLTSKYLKNQASVNGVQNKEGIRLFYSA